jgi:hypothetical protein
MATEYKLWVFNIDETASAEDLAENAVSLELGAVESELNRLAGEGWRVVGQSVSSNVMTFVDPAAPDDGGEIGTRSRLMYTLMRES